MWEIDRTRPRLMSARRRLPRWLGRLARAGIISEDSDVRRRQLIVNIASAIGIANNLGHTIYNAVYAFEPLLSVNVYNLVLVVLFLFVHRMHQYGDVAGALLMVTAILFGNLYVVWAFGIEGGAHVYYTMGAAMFVLFGPGNWRLFAAYLVSAYVVIVAIYALVPQVGSVLIDDAGFRRQFSMQITLNVLTINALLIVYTVWALRRTEVALAAEAERTETLLNSLLPPRIALRLKNQPDRRIADHYDQVTVLVVDLSGNAVMINEDNADAAVEFLDSVHNAFDRITDRYGLEAIKTAGDIYIAVGGLKNEPRLDAIAAGGVALEMAEELTGRARGDRVPTLRAGIHVGPAVAGVIGKRRIIFNVWGEAMSGAFEVLSGTAAGSVRVTEPFKELVGETFRYEPGEPIQLDPIGQVSTAQLVGIASVDKG